MDNPTSPINPSKEELELLSPSLAASLCSVSEARFNSWIEQGFMPLLDYKGAKMVRSSDLIGHLVTYNIRIPARLLDQGQKKILCIMQGSALDAETVTYLIRYLYLVRKKENCIIDFTKHGEHAESHHFIGQAGRSRNPWCWFKKIDQPSDHHHPSLTPVILFIPART